MGGIVILLMLVITCVHGQTSLNPDQDCGIEEEDLLSPRVAGGGNVTAEDVPWNVILEQKKFENAERIVTHCGGNILTPTIILTAAHCLWGNNGCPDEIRNLETAEECHQREGESSCTDNRCLRLRPQDVNVYVGISRISPKDEIPQKVNKIQIHEQWVKSLPDSTNRKSGHDMAILHLEKEMTFKERIKPICLPRQDLTLDVGRNVNVNGYGYVDGHFRTLAERLQQGIMQLFDKDYCTASFPGHVEGDQLCAHSDGVDSCRGDSGGGLTTVVDVGLEKTPITVLVGLTSFGAPYCSGEQPAVYTNVKTHMQWIINNIFARNGENTTCLTIGGPGIGSPCVFPFKYRQTTHYSCTVVGAHDGLPWCSTLVDQRGNHVLGKGKWGHCGEDCLAKPGDEVIFLTGGLDNSGSVLRSTEVFDVAAGSPCSRITAQLPEGRVYHSINAINNTVIICGGGFDTETQLQTSCISASSPDGPWSNHSVTTVPRQDHGSAIAGGTIHIVGGDTVESLVDGVWRQGTKPPYVIGGASCITQISDKEILVIGGDTSPRRVAIWNVKTNEWRQLTRLRKGRVDHGCALVSPYQVLIVGGTRGEAGETYKSSGIYHVKERWFEDTGDMNITRTALQVVAVNVDGRKRIFALGGFLDGRKTLASDNVLDTVEEFIMSTKQWIPSPLKLKNKRIIFSAVSVQKSTFC